MCPPQAGAEVGSAMTEKTEMCLHWASRTLQHLP
ncbi:lymphoblastomic leukemia, isoform CRA_a [Mus musculus]|nr:lymphoblastomic leukemia, isoform CRA_a [Mus musculus]